MHFGAAVVYMKRPRLSPGRWRRFRIVTLSWGAKGGNWKSLRLIGDGLMRQTCTHWRRSAKNDAVECRMLMYLTDSVLEERRMDDGHTLSMRHAKLFC